MTQAQLNRAVARATGETVNMVEQLGFSLLVIPEPGATSRWARRHRGSIRSKNKQNPVPRAERACRLA